MMDFFLFGYNQCMGTIWLMMALCIVSWIFKKMPRKYWLILWALVAVKLIFPWEINSVFSLNPGQEITQRYEIQEIGRPPTVTVRRPHLTDGKLVTEDDIDSVTWEMNYTGVRSFSSVSVFLWFFILVKAGILSYAAMSFWKLKTRIAFAVRVEENVWICDYINTPFIIGIIRPQIYLPSNLSKEEMEYVLLHERAHIRRKDPLWKAIGFIVFVVYLYHAVILCAYIMFLNDIELACDEAVIRDMSLEQRKEYSTVLLNVSSSQYKILACPLAFGEVGVKERIKSILNYKKPGLVITAVAIITCIVLGVCFVTEPKDVGIIGGADGPTQIIVAEQTESISLHKDFETVKRELSVLSEDIDALEKSGCVVIGHNYLGNLQIWNEFYTTVGSSQAAEVIIAKYTVEGDLILDYLSYDGYDFYHVCDFSRNQFSSSGEKYFEESYRYLYLYEVKDEENMTLQVAALSDIPDVSYKKYTELLFEETSDGNPKCRELFQVRGALENFN